jgi:hypothetical protein
MRRCRIASKVHNKKAPNKHKYYERITKKHKKNTTNTHTIRNFVFCNLSYATKKSHMQLFWSCMQHVQLHATFFSYIRQVAKDKISTSDNKEMLKNTRNT